ncbi:MAG: DUF3311 domain-containing protein [Gammaproteobacteria bacterium]|nr:DUF3311 domain-containing protein [Gammaproteobacteria bacterium]MBU6509943.1 DUF3311 domain-containing protein [Gammaproteobacteria bacterium]MDE1983286.1 DUF3311 domain-containing protein [Gammaproteobacteria bacterium]MDE2108670.1 DUF3311 domain-containing protein [Gammaproteobacteria bacterium]MDE2460970.1 DUF3311 domain-containing protein [Gammaproteobacteria bacterium]
MSRTKRTVWIVALFAIPYVPVMWVGLYNRTEPALFGIPFFYWFQFVWIIATAIVTAVTYLAKV